MLIMDVTKPEMLPALLARHQGGNILCTWRERCSCIYATVCSELFVGDEKTRAFARLYVPNKGRRCICPAANSVCSPILQTDVP